jgi:hypothetical protein
MKGQTVSEKIEITEFCIFLLLPWQRQPYWNMSTLPATLQGTLINAMKFHHDRSSHSRETVRTKCVEEEE